MRFALPQFLWLLLLVPALAAFLWWGMRKRQALMASFIAPRLLGALTVGVSARRDLWRAIALVAALACLVLALARPQWGFFWEEVAVRGLDIVVAVDTSKSMLAEDIAPNRLARAKLAAMDLARQAKSDRLGLVAFAGSGFLQCPLTIDEAAFRQAVDSLTISTIPVGGSVLAEAVSAALPAFKEGDNHRVLVILSDGEDNAEGALEAARKAAETGLKIYCIGVGTVEGERIPVKRSGTAVEHVTDEQGNVVLSKLNEALLRELASTTEGGLYLPLRGARTMETLYQEVLAKLPKAENQEKLVKQYRERFHWPLGLGILLLIVEALWPTRARPANSTAASARVMKAAACWMLGAALVSAVSRSEAASAGSALREYNAGKYQNARRQYEELLKKNPDDLRLHYNAGAAAYQGEQYEEALKRFTETLSSPDLELQQRAYYNRGNTEFRLGEQQEDSKQRSEHWKKAIRDYESALKLNTQDTEATFNRDLVKKMLEELQQQQQQQQNQNDQNQENQQDQNQSQQQNQSSQQQQEKNQQDQQQNQEQQQSQQQDSSQQQQSQQQESQQSPQNREAQQQREEPKPQDQEKQQQGQKQPSEEKSNEENADQKPAAAGQMTPEQARRMLEAQREGEKMLPSGQNQAGGDRRRPVKDW